MKNIEKTECCNCADLPTPCLDDSSTQRLIDSMTKKIDRFRWSFSLVFPRNGLIVCFKKCLLYPFYANQLLNNILIYVCLSCFLKFWLQDIKEQSFTKVKATIFNCF